VRAERGETLLPSAEAERAFHDGTDAPASSTSAMREASRGDIASRRSIAVSNRLRVFPVATAAAAATWPPADEGRRTRPKARATGRDGALRSALGRLDQPWMVRRIGSPGSNAA
jgi:hypothetical protein